MFKSTGAPSKPMSIGTKMDLALVTLFLLMLAASGSYQYASQRGMVEELVQNQANELADSYFDNVNTMMLTGVIANRDIPRKKIMSREEILDARIVRGAQVNKIFGEGEESGKVVDELDRQGLEGTKVELIRDRGDSRVLTVVQPLRASEDFRGTNCLTCHVTSEGEILGAVRIDYSLKALDAKVTREVWLHIGLNTVMMVLALLGLSYILRRLIIRPVKAVRETVHQIEQQSDLSLRVPVESRDEVGSMAGAINSMMDKFSQIIGGVLGSMEQLVEESQRLAAITGESTSGARKQQMETDQVATAMTEMEQNSHEVANNASQATEVTSEADKLALSGGTVVKETISSINNLAEEITGASSVVQQLEADSESITRVVEVISTIAEQTNLLALNAAIEAARAGEQGRGFAVVADEVRTLANRTHESTQEIQGMIENLQSQARQAATVMLRSQDHAGRSVQQAEKAGGVLDQITDAVSHVTRMNEQIALAAREQSTVASEMNRNVVGINEVTVHTANSSQQLSQVSDKLSELAFNLKQMVEQFKA